MTEPTGHVTHDDLVLHFYGEDAGAGVEDHLAACASCRATLERLRQTLAIVDQATEGEPPPGYEAVLWARLQDQLEVPLPWWRRLVQDGPVRWAMAATLTAVLAVAFVAGWLARDVSAPARSPAGTAAALAGARLLDMAVGEHLERAQMVLAEVLNAAAPSPDALARDRERAADLVAASRLYQQSAALAGDRSMDAVLEDLERVLTEIANAPADISPADLEALRTRVERTGLVFRVRVLTEELRERRQPGALVQKKGRES